MQVMPAFFSEALLEIDLCGKLPAIHLMNTCALFHNQGNLTLTNKYIVDMPSAYQRRDCISDQSSDVNLSASLSGIDLNGTDVQSSSRNMMSRPIKHA